MQKALLTFQITMALCCSTAALAQNNAPLSPPPQSAAPLEERYNECLSTAICPLQTRLQIIQEESDDMNAHFHNIYEACAATNFQNCADSQAAEMSLWHSADYRVDQMMLSIEAQSLAMKEAAAGGADNTPQPQQQQLPQKKSLWDRLWGR